MPQQTMECEYCGFNGVFPTEVELRERADGSSIFACTDKQACDERDAAQAQALGEDMRNDA